MYEDLKINFNLEMHNAGEFLFNGFEALYNTGGFVLDYEIFNIFYNISVGIERTQKVILAINIDKLDPKDKKALYKHNYQILHQIIKKRIWH